MLTPNGNILHRNRSHIPETGEKHTRVNMDDLPQPAPQMPVVVTVPPDSPNTSGSELTPAGQDKPSDNGNGWTCELIVSKKHENLLC